MPIPNHPVLEQAARYFDQPRQPRPEAAAIASALAEAEKQSKQHRVRYRYADLLGTWRLVFITGTQRSRQQAGQILGAGRFVPRWIRIQLTYQQRQMEGVGSTDFPDSTTNAGCVGNTVAWGTVRFALQGPTQFWPQSNSLAFDFTRLKLEVWGLTLYNGSAAGGGSREATFYQQPLKKQAFFTYFLIQGNLIAARGRGGGLALWAKSENAEQLNN
jgi:hypothetical protein